VAVASAGPYANQHLDPDTQHPRTQFFTGQMLFLLPNQQCQNTEGNVDELIKFWGQQVRPVAGGDGFTNLPLFQKSK